MIVVKPNYITDDRGKKISAVLPIEEFETLLEHLEDLGDERFYDESKKSEEPSIPIDEAFKMIEAKRKKIQI
jgi:hypothetical protein